MKQINKFLIITTLSCLLFSNKIYAVNYQILNSDHYKKIVSSSRTKISSILKELKTNDLNSRIALISQQLADIPYIYKNGMGEGDWQPHSNKYIPGAVHINQNPVYRLDTLNCQTFVQVAMALLYSNNLSEFDKNILKISYGAAGNPDGNIVRYYNRNNFIDADFNPVNQQNGWLVDVTNKGILSSYAKKTYATISRQNWFLHQRHGAIQVLNPQTTSSMIERLNTKYGNLNFSRFDAERISVHYIPKELLALRLYDGTFKPNLDLLNNIPTPAIAEIVRDIKKWNYYGTNMKDIIGSELTISHLGLLYRKRFNQGDLIYQKTYCEFDDNNKKVCEVKPVICQKTFCDELMFTHATDVFPSDYYWYKKSDGNYTCSSQLPTNQAEYTSCNRVVSLPFYDYLTEYQFGTYWNMELKSLLGVHFEQLLHPRLHSRQQTNIIPS